MRLNKQIVVMLAVLAMVLAYLGRSATTKPKPPVRHIPISQQWQDLEIGDRVDKGGAYLVRTGTDEWHFYDADQRLTYVFRPRVR